MLTVAKHLIIGALLLGAAINSKSVWWETSNDLYSFSTDLDKAKGGKFVKDAMRTMDALRKSYEQYVPKQKEIGKCKVKVFKSLKGYNEYIGRPDNTTNVGMWRPMQEELLIVAEDKEQAQTTMRHEAFHQYLHYATGRGDHAMWFNEGFACFFESVKYNTANKTIKVIDDGNRAAWVDNDPERVARAIRNVLKLDYEGYYSGDKNLHYITGWAIVYFLERGSLAHKDFAEYAKVIPKYLEMMNSGANWREATEAAWAEVADRDVEADFIRFWKSYRKRARKAK